jgi:siroheme synthase
MPGGSLTVVGSGILTPAHITVEARACIEQAQKVLFVVADPATSDWITKLNPTAESLYPFYREGKDQLVTYREMVDRIMSCVRQRLNVRGGLLWPSRGLCISRSRGD